MKQIVIMFVVAMLAAVLVGCGSNPAASGGSPGHKWDELVPGGSNLTMSSSPKDIRDFLDAYTGEPISDADFEPFVANLHFFCKATDKEIKTKTRVLYDALHKDGEMDKSYDRLIADYDIIMTEICYGKSDPFLAAAYRNF